MRCDVATLVYSDIEARVQRGERQYGERLTTHNGRDALLDAYQEALDLVLYLRQALEERGVAEGAAAMDQPLPRGSE
jgi:hypothetical protein